VTNVVKAVVIVEFWDAKKHDIVRQMNVVIGPTQEWVDAHVLLVQKAAVRFGHIVVLRESDGSETAYAMEEGDYATGKKTKGGTPLFKTRKEKFRFRNYYTDRQTREVIETFPWEASQ